MAKEIKISWKAQDGAKFDEIDYLAKFGPRIGAEVFLGEVQRYMSCAAVSIVVLCAGPTSALALYDAAGIAGWTPVLE